MVAAAEQDQVVEVGLAAVGPVHDVVGVQPTRSRAAGSPAVPVPVLQEPEDVQGNGAGAAPQLDGHASGVLDDGLTDRVTGQPSRGDVRDRDTRVAGVEVCARVVRGVVQRGFGGVHDQGRALRFRVRRGVLAQRLDENIRTADGERLPLAVLVGPRSVGASGERGCDRGTVGIRDSAPEAQLTALLVPPVRELAPFVARDRFVCGDGALVACGRP